MSAREAPPATRKLRPAVRWAVAGLAALPALHLAPFDFDRGAALLFVPFVVLTVLGRAPAPASALPRADRLLLVALALAAFAGTVFSPHWAASLSLIAAWLWTLAIPTGLHRLRPGALEAGALLAGAAAGGVLGILLVSVKALEPDLSAFPVYGNPRLMGLHLLCGALASMALLSFHARSRGERVASASLTLALCTGLFWTGGRAPVLGLAAGGAALLWSSPPESRVRRGLHLTLLTLTALAFSFAIPPLGAAAGIGGAWERSSAATSLAALSSGRLDFWRVTLRHALEAPWFGHGADAYNFIRPKQDGNQPHNFLLQWFVDFGVFGALPLALLVAHAWFRGAAQSRAAGGGALAARCGWACLTGLLVAGLLDGVFYHAIVLVPLVFFLGLMLSSNRVDDPAERPPLVAKAVWTASLGGAALLLALHHYLYFSLIAAPPESPRAPAARLLRVFPCTTNALWRWLEAWKEHEPEASVEWASWATTHSHVPAIYHAFVGKMLLDRGDLAGAEKAYRLARATTHHTSRAHFDRILSLLAKARAEDAAPAAAAPPDSR